MRRGPFGNVAVTSPTVALRRNMIKSFYTASLLLDVLSVFGEMSDEVSSCAALARTLPPCNKYVAVSLARGGRGGRKAFALFCRRPGGKKPPRFPARSKRRE